MNEAEPGNRTETAKEKKPGNWMGLVELEDWMQPAEDDGSGNWLKPESLQARWD